MDTITSATQAANAAKVVDGTDASTSEANGAAKAESSSQELIKNLKGEFQRKLSKLDEKLTAVLNRTVPAQSAQAVDDTPEVDQSLKGYVDSVLTREKQVDAWKEATELFPELQPGSEGFDEQFYNAVDAEFTQNLRKDPRGPLKAAKMAALELGKIEKLTRHQVLQDEARRSRIIGEGATSSRETKKESSKDPSKNFNRDALRNKLGIDPDKLAKRIAGNKEKYD